MYANFDHYGTRDRLAGLVRGDMHRHPFRQDLEEVSEPWMCRPILITMEQWMEGRLSQRGHAQASLQARLGRGEP